MPWVGFQTSGSRRFAWVVNLGIARIAVVGSNDDPFRAGVKDHIPAFEI